MALASNTDSGVVQFFLQTMEVALLICTSVLGWWLTWSALKRFKHRRVDQQKCVVECEEKDIVSPTPLFKQPDIVEEEAVEPSADAVPQERSKKVKKRSKKAKSEGDSNATPASVQVGCQVESTQNINVSSDVTKGAPLTEEPEKVRGSKESGLEESFDGWCVVEAGGKVKKTAQVQALSCDKPSQQKLEAEVSIVKTTAPLSYKNGPREDSTASTSADDAGHADANLSPTPTIPTPAIDVGPQQRKLAASKILLVSAKATIRLDAPALQVQSCQPVPSRKTKEVHVTTPEIPVKEVLAIEERKESSRSKRDTKRGKTGGTKRRTKKERVQDAGALQGISSSVTIQETPPPVMTTHAEKLSEDGLDKLSWAQRIRRSVMPEKEDDGTLAVCDAHDACCPKLISQVGTETQCDSCYVAGADVSHQKSRPIAPRCPLSLLDSDDDDVEPEPKASRCRPASEALGFCGGAGRGSTSATVIDAPHVGAAAGAEAKLDTGPRMLGECVRWGSQGFGFIRSESGEQLFVRSSDVRCDEQGQRCLRLGQLVWFRRGLGNWQGRGNAVQIVQVDDDSAWSIRKADRAGIPRSRLRYEIDGDVSVLKEGEVDADQREFGSFIALQQEHHFSEASHRQEVWMEHGFDAPVDAGTVDLGVCICEEQQPVEMLPPGSWNGEMSCTASPSFGYVMVPPMLDPSQDMTGMMSAPEHASCCMHVGLQHDAWLDGAMELQWDTGMEGCHPAFEFDLTSGVACFGDGLTLHPCPSQQQDTWDQEWGGAPQNYEKHEMPDSKVPDLHTVGKARGSLQSRYRCYQQQQQGKWKETTFTPSSVVVS